MPFEKGKSGNPSGVQSNKPFLAALKRALAQDDGKKLRAAAERLIELAAQGEPWAVKELADRTDGKPATVVEGGDPDKPLRQRIEVAIVDAAD